MIFLIDVFLQINFQAERTPFLGARSSVSFLSRALEGSVVLAQGLELYPAGYFGFPGGRPGRETKTAISDAITIPDFGARGSLH